MNRRIAVRLLAFSLLVFLAGPPTGLANPKWTFERVVEFPVEFPTPNTCTQSPAGASLASQGGVLFTNASSGKAVTVTFPGAPPQLRCVYTVTLTLDHGGIQSVLKTFSNVVGPSSSAYSAPDGNIFYGYQDVDQNNVVRDRGCHLLHPDGSEEKIQDGAQCTLFPLHSSTGKTVIYSCGHGEHVGYCNATNPDHS